MIRQDVYDFHLAFYRKLNGTFMAGITNNLKETHPAYNFIVIVGYTHDTPQNLLPHKMYSLYMNELDYIVPDLFK